MADSKPDPTSKPGEELELSGFRDGAEPAGLSLEQLGAAFAQMLGQGRDPYGEAGAAQEDPANQAAEDVGHVPFDPAADESCDVSPRSILEAMFFVGHPRNEPLTSSQVAGLMRGVSAAEVDDLVADLNQHYQDHGCPYEIVSEGAGYRMQLRHELNRVRDRFYGRVRQARLSHAALEVLALVAYNEPLSAEEINAMRSATSNNILSQLVRRQLLRIERPSDEPRKPNYYTTQRFLDLFKLSDLGDLPRSEEIEKR